MKNKKDLPAYHRVYLNDYGFEAEIVQARQRMILDVLKILKPTTILEVSCGPELLYQRARASGIPIKKWVIVEADPKFSDMARRSLGKDKKVHVLHALFENAAAEIKRHCPEPIDLIILAGILNEAEQPRVLLETARELLSPRGKLHANVPNASSLHRRLGKTMGLIQNEKGLSERNTKFHQQNFDMDSFKKLVSDCGFRIEETGGYFLKPFAHHQMSAIKKILTADVLNGLWLLGRQYPDWSTEIYLNAKLKNER
ncbi:MAG: methyltransferase domain-containing protein [Candidatus Omnitrophota bacterium]